jgi:hypothetical protein
MGWGLDLDFGWKSIEMIWMVSDKCTLSGDFQPSKYLTTFQEKALVPLYPLPLSELVQLGNNPGKFVPITPPQAGSQDCICLA